jgi:two-component system nitrate/nitrite response regulator NarL
MPDTDDQVRILIADDHPVFRLGLRKLLEAESGICVIGEAADGEEALRLVRQLKPALLLLDISMPNVHGLDTLRDMNKSEFQTRTIVLTASIAREQVIEALQLGANGIVMKHSATELLIKSIRSVMAGQYWLGHESISDLVHVLRRVTPQHSGSKLQKDFGITPREREVVGLIVAGYTNKDLALKLGISEQTVKHHLTNIFDKLGVSNRLELVLFAIDHQLIDRDRLESV